MCCRTELSGFRKAKEVDSIFFIVGMSRSGTTWLSKCLNLHEDIASFGETLFWGRGYIHPSAQGKYTPQQLEKVISRLANMRPGPRGDGPGCLTKETVERWPEIIRRGLSESADMLISPAEVFKRLLTAVAAAEGKKIAVEKTPHHLNWIARIKEAFPNAKFVATYRDPYDFMLSYKYQGGQRNKRVREVFQRQYHPLLAAVVWRGYMRSIVHAADKYPDSVLIIPLVEINDNPKEVLDRVFLFLGVNQTIEKPLAKENSSFVAPVKPMLQADDIFWINLIARKELVRGGFAPRPLDPKISRITWSILTLPVWLTKNLGDWNKRVRGSVIKYMWSWLKPKRF
ncbi:MAG: sulfotransferase family protein [Gammaproteobacteria bacterium]